MQGFHLCTVLLILPQSELS